ncbi:MAG TPA: condensation domain-containing protein, partial [Thermoanaerobaculia bacterium]|nr:condensation domain-containing protein [Thermoanaerobaculia bacterium]
MVEISDRLAGLSAERRALLEALLRQRAAATAPRPRVETIPAQPRPAGSFPLSFSQERLWFLAQMDPGGAGYNIPLVLDFLGPLEPPALEASLARVVARHEMLRTRFDFAEEGAEDGAGGRPVQIVEPAAGFLLPVVDLAGLPAEVRAGEARRLAMAEARRPFDLAAGRLLRAQLLRLAAKEHRLVANLHHIVSDGWSTSILAREVGQVYRAWLAGATPDLPALPIQYADFAVWQRQTLTGGALEAQVEHWRRTLAGLPPVLELPSDRPRPPVRTPRGGTLGFVLSPLGSERLRELGRGGDGGTLFITLLSGLFSLLQRYTERDDLCVGSPVAGRQQVETEGLIGFFVNTLVLRADLSGDPPFRQALARVREVVFDAHAHQDVPFERLVAELSPERSLDHSPLFQVLFTFQNVPSAALDLGGLRIAPVEVETGTTKFDLGLSMAEEPAGVWGVLEYSLDLFEPSTIARMAGHLRALLEGAAAHPGRRLSELPMLGPSEAQQLLAEWNDTEALYPGRELALHELVFEQAERTPEAVAVEQGEEHLTHAELRRRAGWLAYRLRRLGVAPEVPVALCAERSPEMVVGLLGILEAGGAYVPLDPDYPAERLAYMVEDA